MHHYIQLDSIDSTHLFAKRERHTFSPEGMTWICADSQTHGRGQQGRSWFSPPGVNLYLTLYFQIPPKTNHSLAPIAQLMAWSLTALLLQHTLSPQFKWPNDLLLGHKKWGGILAEIEGNDLFLSVGLNLNMGPESLAPIDQPTTSLFIETGQRWHRTLWLQEMQIQFATDLDRFWTHGFAPFAHAITPLLAYRNQVVRIVEQNKEWQGVIQSIAPDGRLQLLLPDHQIRLLSRGRIDGKDPHLRMHLGS